MLLMYNRVSMQHEIWFGFCYLLLLLMICYKHNAWMEVTIVRYDILTLAVEPLY